MHFELEVLAASNDSDNVRECSLPLGNADIVRQYGKTSIKRNHIGKTTILISKNDSEGTYLHRTIAWPSFKKELKHNQIKLGIDFLQDLAVSEGDRVIISSTDYGLTRKCESIRWELDSILGREELVSLLKIIPRETKGYFIRTHPPQSFSVKGHRLRLVSSTPDSEFLRIDKKTSHTITVPTEFSRTDTLLLVDATRSMMNSDKGKFTPNRFRVVLNSIGNFFRKKALKPSSDQVALRLFTDGLIEKSSQFLDLKECNRDIGREMEETLSGLKTHNGWTSISDALIQGVQLLQHQGKKNHGRLIVLLTDGMHAVDTPSYLRKYPNRQHPTLEDAFEIAKDAFVVVNLLIVGNPNSLKGARLDRLYELVKSTGGKIEYPRESQDLLSFYSTLADSYDITI